MLTYFCVENVPEFQYCFWLFSDVDIFFMCKMFLSFSTDVYVIFLYWNISRSFTDVDIFLCGKCSRISILFLIIYWCWLFFMCKMFLSFRLMFMWFSCTETYQLMWLISCTETYQVNCMNFQNFNIVFDYLVMLTYFLCKMFLSFTDVDISRFYWCDIFLCGKCSRISILFLII